MHFESLECISLEKHMPQSNYGLRTAIAIRAYSENPDRDPVGMQSPSPEIDASPWSLVFDCETTIDATQRLRFGFYQVRRGNRLDQEGIFHDPNAITDDEKALLSNYAGLRHLRLVTVEAFRSEIFLKYSHTRCGTVVGFN